MSNFFVYCTVASVSIFGPSWCSCKALYQWHYTYIHTLLDTLLGQSPISNISNVHQMSACVTESIGVDFWGSTGTCSPVILRNAYDFISNNCHHFPPSLCQLMNQSIISSNLVSLVVFYIISMWSQTSWILVETFSPFPFPRPSKSDSSSSQLCQAYSELTEGQALPWIEREDKANNK